MPNIDALKIELLLALYLSGKRCVKHGDTGFWSSLA
jgi:hypothetical protein